jgi:hypothetical protein
MAESTLCFPPCPKSGISQWLLALKSRRASIGPARASTLPSQRNSHKLHSWAGREAEFLRRSSKIMKPSCEPKYPNNTIPCPTFGRSEAEVIPGAGREPIPKPLASLVKPIPWWLRGLRLHR